MDFSGLGVVTDLLNWMIANPWLGTSLLIITGPSVMFVQPAGCLSRELCHCGAASHCPSFPVNSFCVSRWVPFCLVWAKWRLVH